MGCKGAIANFTGESKKSLESATEKKRLNSLRGGEALDWQELGRKGAPVEVGVVVAVAERVPVAVSVSAFGV